MEIFNGGATTLQKAVKCTERPSALLYMDRKKEPVTFAQSQVSVRNSWEVSPASDFSGKATTKHSKQKDNNR
jgi:hypothetical protein